MIDAVDEALVAADELGQCIVDSVFEYVGNNETRAGFGINAVFRASISLAKCSTMSPQARMMLAQQIFMEMTADLDTSITRGASEH